MFYCLKNDIEFENQTFPQFINQLKEKHFNKKFDRVEISQEIKEQLLKHQQNKCNVCKDELKKYERDHIRPLANVGDNETDNLQLLCKSYHMDKCKLEDEDGSYVRIIDTESSFNKQSLEIIHSDLNKHLAFFEKISDEPEDFIEVDATQKYIDETKQAYFKELKLMMMKLMSLFLVVILAILKVAIKKVYKQVENKLFAIDINKCRKNILYYNIYNYPVFTVMDEINVYDKNKKCKCGWFYIESKQYFFYMEMGGILILLLNIA